MDWWLQAAIITGMFVLRLGIPIAITLLAGYWLRRLDAKWQAEAWAQWEASQAHQEPAEVEPLAQLNPPCWMVKGCDEAARSACPAFHQPGLPCWLARQRTTGRLPAECYTCELWLGRRTASMLVSI